MLQVAATSRPPASTTKSGHRIPVRSTSRRSPGCGWLISQVPPASTPSCVPRPLRSARSRGMSTESMEYRSINAPCSSVHDAPPARRPRSVRCRR
ncbi:Uncharacterised protein [Mycobacteroides abscessus subsp. abscessus]|nr:Uncharacterised protein [Mycobacteroides abscessus subsp. abscessus]